MRMLTRKRLELAHEAVAVARLQLRIDVLFDLVEPQLFEAFDLGARERLLLETPERRPAPQGERVRDATFGDQPLESLQVQLKRTYSSGYGIQLSYTWQDANSIADDAYQVFYNRTLGYGREDNIPDHQLVAAQNYDIPLGRGRRYGQNLNRAVDAVLGGWNVSGTTTFYSGLPFTPQLNGIAGRPYTGPNNRPDVGTGDPYAANQSRDQWLNVGPNGALSSAFAIPAVNTFGNYGNNTLRGPIFINQDVSLAKSFPITERLRVQMRGEAYNIFNHANLGLPNSNVNGNNAGTITAIAFGSTMRRLQFAMRLDF